MTGIAELVSGQPQVPPNAIIAESADGVKHVFPEGTPDAAINRAMKDYARQQTPGYQAAKARAETTIGTPENPKRAENIVNEALTGIPYLDRAPGAVAYLKTAGRNFIGDSDGSSPDDAYAATMDVTRRQRAQYEGEHPFESFAASMVGGAPIAAKIGKFVAGAKSGGGMAARLLGSGAGVGAAYGASGNPDDPVHGAEIGAAVGLGTSIAAPYAARVAQAAGNAVHGLVDPAVAAVTRQNATERTADTLVQRYLRGRDPADLANNPAVQRGAPVTAAEAMGRDAQGFVINATRRGGEAADIATDAMRERQYGAGGPIDGANARILDAVGAATGIHPSTAREAIESIISKGRDAVNPAYTAIRAQQGPVWNAELADLVTTDPHVARALATVKANTRNAPDVPDAATWLRVRQQLADDVQRDPTKNTRLNVDFNDQIDNAARDLGSELKKVIPGFARAQADAAKYKAPEAAFDRAGGMLFGGNSKGKTVADTQKFVDSLKTPEELAAAQHAFADDILGAVNGRTGLRPSALNTPAARQKMSIMFGDTAADQLAAMALDEQNMAQYGVRVNPSLGSVTSQATLGGEANPAIGLAESMAHGALHGGVGGAATGLISGGIRSVGNYLRNPYSQEVRDQTVRHLSQPAADFATTYRPPVASTRSISVPPGINVGAVQASQYLTAPQQGQRQ